MMTMCSGGSKWKRSITGPRVVAVGRGAHGESEHARLGKGVAVQVSHSVTNYGITGAIAGGGL